MKIFCIDGHDGAAKTPIIESAKTVLIEKGLKVATFQPFWAAKRITGKDVYGYWAMNPKFAVKILQAVILGNKIEAQDSNSDIVIFDRGWLTVMAELEGTDKEYLWTEFFRTFFVACSPEKTVSNKAFSSEFEWQKDQKTVEYYNTRYREVAKKYSKFILETYEVNGRIDLTPIVNSIVNHIISNK